MSRSIAEIKKEMTDAFMADETLHLKYGFDNTKSFESQFSKVSLESIILYIVACSIWVLETLFDKHQEEVSDTIAKRAHTLAWYREKAFAFQMDCDLREDIAEYDNSNLTDEQIESSKIVAKCSCEQSGTTFPTILIKAVTEQGAMTEDQLTKFTAYISEIADAGMKVSVVSQNPDKLGLSITIMYDPLICDAEGNVANVGKSVEDYINDYLSSLEYNGKFYPNMLERYLMSCEGVKVANVTDGYVKAENDAVKSIANKMSDTPVSGAYVFDNSIESSLHLTYIPFGNE